ncbi:MAG TPA: hypothetical protein VGK24_05575 [Candidatus Angelobacter sp.]
MVNIEAVARCSRNSNPIFVDRNSTTFSGSQKSTFSKLDFGESKSSRSGQVWSEELKVSTFWKRSAMPHEEQFRRAGYVECFAAERTVDGKSVTRFEPGFYSDGETVYVDMGEFLATHGVCDRPEIRAVLWSDLREIFSGVPVQELRAKTSVLLPRRRTALA